MPHGRTGSGARVAPEIDPLPGTARTASELAEIYEAGLRDPMRYGHLNRRRAELWRERVARSEGVQQPMARYQYATESLSAGDPDTAIHQIEQLMLDAGPAARSLSATTKPLFELLAAAYFRSGEQRNRPLTDPALASLLPFADGAIYPEQDASRRAISLYQEIVNYFPNDIQSRWLLNLAYMTLGMYPQDVPSAVLIPGVIADPDATFPRFPNVAPLLSVDVDGIAGGLSLEDFDEDGFVDILATSRGLNDPMHLFFADGQGGFVDHTGAAGLNGLVGGLNTMHADYDNDGDEDVLILRGGWLGAHGNHPNSLLRNNGGGTFEDVAADVGLSSRHPTQTAAWGDFNNDGWIDLFIGNEAGPNGGGSGRSELFMNDGAGSFAEVSAQVGIDVFEFVKSVAWGDVNNDGLVDLYLSIVDGPNELFINRGGSGLDDWWFEEVAAAAGVQEPIASFPVLFFDFDNDGWEDLFVASFDIPRSTTAAGEIAAELLGLPRRAERNRLYRNNRDGTFTDVAADLGLDLSLWSMGINFGDVNNDGFQDIYVGTGTPDLRSIMPNRMFLNEGGTRFRDITFEGGFGHIQKGHAIAFADFDRDGDQDVYAVMGGAVEGDHYPNALFENPGAGGENSWVVLDLVGRTANRSAIGARIKVTTTDADGRQRAVYRTVSTGGSFGSSNLLQEIGLGSAVRIDEVQISWPNREGSVETYADLPVNAWFRIVEGQEPVRHDVAPVVLGGHDQR